jgi:hypothetical protein
MILGNRKYVDPTPVLIAMTDDDGNPVHIGEQKDIGEFNLKLLECIEEGLGEKSKENLESLRLDGLSDSSKNRVLLDEISSDNFGKKILNIKLNDNQQQQPPLEQTMKQIFFGSKVEILKLVHLDD